MVVLTRSLKLVFPFPPPSHHKAILHFVNQRMSSLGLHVDDVDQQVGDGSTSEGLCWHLVTSSCVLSAPVCWRCDSAAADRTAGGLLRPATQIQPDPCQLCWDGTEYIRSDFLTHCEVREKTASSSWTCSQRVQSVAQQLTFSFIYLCIFCAVQFLCIRLTKSEIIPVSIRQI